MARKPPPSDPDTLSRLLKDRLQARGDRLDDQLNSSRRKMPPAVRRAADEISAAETRARYRPDLPAMGEQKLTAARAKVAEFASARDVTAEKQKARRRWVADLTINLAILLALILAVRWIAAG